MSYHRVELRAAPERVRARDPPPIPPARVECRRVCHPPPLPVPQHIHGLWIGSHGALGVVQIRVPGRGTIRVTLEVFAAMPVASIEARAPDVFPLFGYVDTR